MPSPTRRAWSGRSIFEAIEAALASATRKKHGGDIDVRVSHRPRDGRLRTFRRWKVVADDAHGTWRTRSASSTLDAAREPDPAAEAGGFIEEPMDSVAFGRIAAQTAKQVIVQKVREAERAQGRRGVTGTAWASSSPASVKRLDRGQYLCSISAAMPRPRPERAHDPARVGAPRRPAARLSATTCAPSPAVPSCSSAAPSPQLLIELFKLEVPEVGEGLIEIKAAARDPGSRAKIAVRTRDPRIDPVAPASACAARGSRRCPTSSPASGWTSSCGTTTRPSSSSTPCRRPT